MGKKEKTKMSLQDFLGSGDGPTSWADEMDSLPTAPAFRDDSDPKAGMRRPDYVRPNRQESDRPQRPDLPLPTRPPFTAFVGNLSFEVTEGDLEDLFAGLKTISVRIVRGPDEKPKGFGYVEFESLDDLKSALAKTGIETSGRSIRVSVADPPKEREESRSAGRWERTGPLPPLQSRGSFRSGDRDGGHEGEERDWTRGAKFVPSAEPPSRSGSSLGFSRTTSERGRPRYENSERGTIEEERDWTRGSKFVPSPTPLSPALSSASVTGNERKGSFRSEGFSGRRDEGVNWRGSGAGPTGMGRTTSSGGFSRSSTTAEPSPRLERRKLELAPRTSPNNAAASPEVTPSTLPPSSSKPSLFGAARPIDTAGKEKEIEERLAKEAEELKEKAEKEKERKQSFNPFGNAKPVDARAREEEIEKKLEKEKEERLKEIQEKKEEEKKEKPLGGAFNNNNNNNKNQERGSGFGHNRVRSQQGKPRGPPPSQQGQTNGVKPAVNAPAAPSQVTSPTPLKQSFRKEGFSYSSMAKAAVTSQPSTQNIDEGLEKVTENVGEMTVDA